MKCKWVEIYFYNVNSFKVGESKLKYCLNLKIKS